MTREKWIYTGVGLLVLLVLVSSTKKVALIEVRESTDQPTFDSSDLPPALKPPYKLAEGEQIPRPIKKNLYLFSIGLKPRFDT